MQNDTNIDISTQYYTVQEGDSLSVSCVILYTVEHCRLQNGSLTFDICHPGCLSSIRCPGHCSSRRTAGSYFEPPGFIAVLRHPNHNWCKLCHTRWFIMIDYVKDISITRYYITSNILHCLLGFVLFVDDGRLHWEGRGRVLRVLQAIYALCTLFFTKFDKGNTKMCIIHTYI